MPRTTKEDRHRQIKWNAYLLYLKEWATEHMGMEYFGMSPACFDEWDSMENEEADDA